MGETVQTYPSVLTSRWSFQGREAQFLVNYLPTEAHVELSLPRQVQTQVYTNEADQGRPLTGGELTIAPLSAALVELSGEEE